MLTRAARLLIIAMILAVSWATDARTAAELDEQNAPPGAAPARSTPRPRPVADPLTASIQGRVTTLDSGAPIRRAEVRAIATNGFSRLTTTDGDGRFDLRDMPAGQFRLTISRSGFVTLSYGQRRPFEAHIPIDLKQGQRFTANVALPRGGAIAGRVYDEGGEPLAGVRVQALRSRSVDGRRRVEPAGPVDLTDDTGAFRLYGLPPADYYVTASAPSRQIAVPPGAQLERDVRSMGVQATLTTFYPGTVSLEEAQRVRLDVGGEARADIQITEARAATIFGAVLTSSGEPAADATVSLRSDVVSLGVSAQISGPPPLMITGHTASDGTFMLPNVPPGSYTLQAVVQRFGPGAIFRTTAGGTQVVEPGTRAVLANFDAPPMPEMAFMPLVVTGGDVSGLTLAANAGGSLEGSYVADVGVTRTLPGGLELTPRWVSGSDMLMRMVTGNTFRLFGLNGTGFLTVNGVPDGWAVKSIISDGEDVIDRPLIFSGGRAYDVRIVLTDRVTTVAGTVSGDAPGRAGDRANHNVVIFAEDPAKWAVGSRYVRTVRTDGQGAFRISGLPPGERYLAVAVDFLEDGEATDPDFLEQLRTRAARFSLAETERRSLDLRLIQR
jgi:hypothetical protein